MNCEKCGCEIDEMADCCPGCLSPKSEPKSEAYKLAWNQAYEAAMQLVYGDFWPTDVKRPTVDSVANLIMRKCDLEWLQSIRLSASSIQSPNT